MTAATVQAELRAAVEEVAAAFDALPSSLQERIGEPIRYGLDAEVEAATAADDDERALAAIRAWRRHWLATFEEASR